MSKENIPYKIYLSEDELPKQWYNVRADMKKSLLPCSILQRESLSLPKSWAQYSAMNS